jgi:lysophospholipase L1-like esterase
MKLKWRMLPALVAAVLLGGSGVAAASPAVTGLGASDQYLSLGDSLAVGFQPGPDGHGRPTTNGFDHDLLPGLQLPNLFHGRALALTELGCPGETTTSMIDGGICGYPGARSQLDAAGMAPANVVFQLTFECTPPPVGPNIHPDNPGYRVLARAVATKL